MEKLGGFLKKYPNFAIEPQNVRLDLVTDRFNPFGNISVLFKSFVEQDDIRWQQHEHNHSQKCFQLWIHLIIMYIHPHP